MDCIRRKTSSDKYWFPTIPPGVGLLDPDSLVGLGFKSIKEEFELSQAYFSKTLVKLGPTFCGVGWIKSSNKTLKISHLKWKIKEKSLVYYS